MKIRYKCDQNIPISAKGLSAPTWKMWLSNPVLKHRVKILHKDFPDLSQIVWTPKNLLLSHSHHVFPLLWTPPVGFGLLFHTNGRGFGEHFPGGWWPGWSLTIIRGDSVDFTWAQWISPSCCKYWVCHTSMCKLLLNPFSLLGIPQSWGGTTGKPPGKSHKHVQWFFFNTQGKQNPSKERWRISNEWSKRWKCLKKELSKHWLFCELTPKSCWGLELPVRSQAKMTPGTRKTHGFFVNSGFSFSPIFWHNNKIQRCQQRLCFLTWSRLKWFKSLVCLWLLQKIEVLTAEINPNRFCDYYGRVFSLLIVQLIKMFSNYQKLLIFHYVIELIHCSIFCRQIP